MYEPIIEALRRGHAADALVAARAAVMAQPQDPQGHRLLAAALRLDGNREGALAAIDQAIALAPEDANLHLERAGLLLQERQLDAAQAALARTIGLDPNQFPAYIVQAQLALGRGDLDQADRIARTAARIAPEHPQIAAIEGILALRRGDPDRALAILTRASERAPDEPQLRHALGFAYLGKGHYAFAEQSFRGMLEADPGSRPLRALIADIVRRQGRPGEAADELAPMLDEDPSPALQRLVGELELEAGRAALALPRLRIALAESPGDRRVLAALIEAWRQLDATDDARATLDALLVDHAQLPDLWRARLAVETFAADARAVADRWLAAMPDAVPALVARMTILDAEGELALAEAAALRITELEPGHTQAELRVIDGLLQRDADAASARVESLLARVEEAQVQRHLRQLLGRTFDLAGQPDTAAATWAELHAEAVSERLPLPQPTAALPQWPPLAPRSGPESSVLLLWGAPGSLVERVAMTFDLSGTPLRADRFGPEPPSDPLQRYGTPAALVDGTLDGAYLVAQWRAGLAARGIPDGHVIDWLLWWDNALLLALRPHLPEAVLLVALRDPRDMLLEWLGYGSPAPFALESPVIGARWLAQVLTQVAELHEQDLFPHHLLRLDMLASDPLDLAQTLADVLGVTTMAPPEDVAPQNFEAGHWRAYAKPLAEAFALLTPVAQRLGYSET
jgi:predicted Zn-dependent protease